VAFFRGSSFGLTYVTEKGPVAWTWMIVSPFTAGGVGALFPQTHEAAGAEAFHRRLVHLLAHADQERTR
jgi:hypothetical protein